jgi:hypothetical protein
VSDDLPTPANYHGNSHKAKGKLTTVKNEETPAEKPAVEPVAQGVKRKKSVGKRFIEAFTGEDVQSVGQYVFWDVLIPAAKSMILEAITTGVERTMYGDSRPRSSSVGRRSGYVSYNRMSKPTSTYNDSGWKPRELSRGARARHNFEDILLGSRAEAEEVLDKLTSLIEKYDVATVSDLYSMVQITGEYTDDKWGWTRDEVNSFDIRRISQGYMLILPRPVEIR